MAYEMKAKYALESIQYSSDCDDFGVSTSFVDRHQNRFQPSYVKVSHDSILIPKYSPLILRTIHFRDDPIYKVAIAAISYIKIIKKKSLSEVNS